MWGDTTNSRPPCVVVIDDHALLAQSVVMTLRASGIEAFSVAFDTPDLVAAAQQRSPTLVLLDLFLGDDVETSLAALAAFTAVGLPVLVVTASGNRLLHARCVEKGAVGIIEKSAPIEVLLEGVERVLRSESVMSKGRAVELLNELQSFRRSSNGTSAFASLTPRERSVLHALTLGHPAGWIARDHQTSIVTVRTHIRSLLLKLDVHSQLEAVALAVRQEWFK